MVMVNGVTWTMVVAVRGVVIPSGEEVWKASVSSHEDSVIVHITAAVGSLVFVLEYSMNSSDDGIWNMF